MKIAAVRSNFPERVGAALGPLDREADTGSIRSEAGKHRSTLNREQLVRIGSIGVRPVYVGGLKEYDVTAVGRPCAAPADNVAKTAGGSGGQRQTPHRGLGSGSRKA